ncbi:bacteriophage holin [bacterium]|nr:bacteriophage holin [bacterium]
MKLRPLALALACGIFWGATVMISTWWLLIAGSSGELISLLGKFYFGYSFCFVGGFVGLVWGFVDGLICGFLFALLYNAFVRSPQANVS